MIISHREVPSFFSTLRDERGSPLRLHEYFSPFEPQIDHPTKAGDSVWSLPNGTDLRVEFFYGNASAYFADYACLVVLGAENKPVTIVCPTISITSAVIMH